MGNRTKTEMEIHRGKMPVFLPNTKDIRKHITHQCHYKQGIRVIQIITKTHTKQRNTTHDHKPQETQWKYRNKICYGPKKQQWECQQCREKYGPYSMRNAIPHASARNNMRTQRKQTQWKEWAQEETEIRDARLRTLREHNPYPEINPETPNKTEEKRQKGTNRSSYNDNENAKTQENTHQTNTPWGEIGYMRKELQESEGGKTKIWSCSIEQCERKSHRPNNIAKHIEKAHKQHNTRFSRQQVHFPVRNKEYSNAIALLTHLAVRTTKMTWRPNTCEMVKRNIIPPQANTTTIKWHTTQQHNEPNRNFEQNKKQQHNTYKNC